MEKTFKEEALELIQHYIPYTNSYGLAKELAIFNVEKILEALEDEIILYRSDYRHEAYDKWEEVKKEIEKFNP